MPFDALLGRFLSHSHGSSGGGDASTDTTTSVDSEVAVFSGAGGKTLKRATGSGIARLVSGVLSAVSNVSLTSEVTGTLPVANGGTNAGTASDARISLGLGSVDNTSDTNKSVSTAQNAADLLRLLKAGDTMTGPLVLSADPTVALGAATKQYVDGIQADPFTSDYLTTATETFNRRLAQSSVGGVAGQMVLSYFTARESRTISKLGVAVVGAAVGGTARRLGLFTAADDGTVTLVARSAANTTMFGTANAIAEEVLDATGGFVSTYNVVKGTRYAIGYITVGTTTAPTFRVNGGAGAMAGLSPVLGTSRSSQTDLASATAAQLSAFGSPTWAYAAT